LLLFDLDSSVVVAIVVIIVNFLPFLFVVEIEMTILGSRHFLITTTQNGSKSPKLTYCVVERFLALEYPHIL
jgi:hypothetical protein